MSYLCVTLARKIFPIGAGTPPHRANFDSVNAPRNRRSEFKERELDLQEYHLLSMM